MSAKENKVFSVSELSQILKACFENPMFSSLSVYGEVYSLRLGKFAYLDLGDQGHKETNSPLLRCAFNCYYGSGYGLEEIKVGDVVEITGSLSYYAHGSSLTLWGKKITVLQSQSGKALLEKRKTLEMLDKLGYLDPKRKRSIPRFVKRVAILTAQSGAAYQDILKTLHDRFPVDTVLFPTIVQGDGAAKSIIASLKRANQGDFDVLILGRGGGSKTDLSCFDDAGVALAIAESKIPVITCIGHTIDTAIADRISDIQTITPTEGAMKINPSKEEIIEERKDLENQLYQRYQTILNRAYFLLSEREKRLESLSPLTKLKKEKASLKEKASSMFRFYRLKLSREREMLSSYRQKLYSLFQARLGKEQERILRLDKTIESYHPSLFLSKGYALVLKDDHIVKEAKELHGGERITITFSDGRKEAVIEGEKENGKENTKQ